MAKKILLVLLGVIIGFGVALPVLGLPKEDNSGIKINTAFKTEYYMGENLDVSGGIIDYTDRNNTTQQIAIYENMVSGFTSATAGTRNLIVTHGSYTCMIPYTVKEAFSVKDSMIYKINDEDSQVFGCLFKDNATKLTFAEQDGKKVENVGDVIYTFDGCWNLTSKQLVDGKYELTYENQYERCKVVNITKTGFTWQHINKSTGAVDDEFQCGEYGSIIEQPIDGYDYPSYYSFKHMPSNTGVLANTYLYIQFREGCREALLGEKGRSYVEFNLDKRCNTTIYYKGGKPVITFSYTDPNGVYIEFKVYDITETSAMVELVNFDNLILELGELY